MTARRARRSGRRPAGKLELRLYVAGDAPNSILAQKNLRTLLEESGQLQVELSIVDVFERPDLASEHQVYVTPMLVRLSPPPMCRAIGTLRDREAVLQLLAAPGTAER